MNLSYTGRHVRQRQSSRNPIASLMTRTDPSSGVMRIVAWLLASLCLVLQTACSEGASEPERSTHSAHLKHVAGVPPTSTNRDAVAHIRSTGAPAPAPKRSAKNVVSKVIQARDRTLSDGKRVCDIDFVYAGREPEDLFWEEPCAAVTAKMVDQGELEALGRWSRLDAFQRKFVDSMLGGRVLYVEGGFSASIYPIDETGTSIEVAVAD